MKNKDNIDSKDPLMTLKIAGVIAAIFWVCNLIFGATTSLCGEFGSRLGDSFGVVNALFSSVAVAGAIYAVILQQREYHEAKKQADRSEQHQQDLAELEALSAYSQCLAACAGNLTSKSADYESRFSKMTEASLQNAEELGITDPEVYQKYVNDRLELHQKIADCMMKYSEHANEITVELMASLERMKNLPLVAKTIAYIASPDLSMKGSKEI